MRRPSLRRSLLLAISLHLGAAHVAHAQSPLVPNCNAAGCLPANWSPGQIAAGYGLADGFKPGQTFTPKMTGALTSVRLGLQTAGAVDAVVQVRATSNGLPTATVLGTATVPGAPYAPGIYSADFSAQNIVLVSGTRYAITFTGLSPQIITVLGAFPPCFAGTSGANDYVHSFDDGATWTKLETRDRSILFEVCLDAATPAAATTWGRVKSIYR